MRWSLLAFLLAGCVDPGSTFSAHVTDEAGTALVDAVVAVTCAQAEGKAGRTGADGRVDLDLYVAAPGACVVTSSLPGYDPQQLRDVEACPADATCDGIEIVLARVIP